MKRLLMVFAMASVGVVSSASASSLVFDGTTLTGVTGLDVGGTFYDVTFVEGSCETVFSGCDSPDFDFTTGAGATAAANALLAAIGSQPPETIFGCTSTSECGVLIPQDADGFAVGRFRVRNSAGTDSVDAATSSVFFDTASDAEAVWADFSPAAAPVPEPATLALLTLGAAGIGARRWRRRKA